jgi:hypothetical protein
MKSSIFGPHISQQILYPIDSGAHPEPKAKRFNVRKRRAKRDIKISQRNDG